MVENGLFYSTFVDPFLKSMRKEVAAVFPGGSRIIDVACGTGAQVFYIARNAERAVGVDLSESMIKMANRTRKKHDLENTSFYTGNAFNLSQFGNKEFGFSVLSLALHQFAPGEYSKILSEMKRISGHVAVLDYAAPLPGNFFGNGIKVAEVFAGREHHRNFRKYLGKGGLNQILPANGLAIDKSMYFGKGSFHFAVCSHTE